MPSTRSRGSQARKLAVIEQQTFKPKSWSNIHRFGYRWRVEGAFSVIAGATLASYFSSPSSGSARTHSRSSSAPCTGGSGKNYRFCRLASWQDNLQNRGLSAGTPMSHHTREEGFHHTGALSSFRSVGSLAEDLKRKELKLPSLDRLMLD